MLVCVCVCVCDIYTCCLYQQEFGSEVVLEALAELKEKISTIYSLSCPYTHTLSLTSITHSLACPYKHAHTHTLSYTHTSAL